MAKAGKIIFAVCTIISVCSPSAKLPAAVKYYDTVRSVAYNGVNYIATGTGGVIVSSPDTSNWTVVNSGVSDDLTKVIWNGSLYVIIGASGEILTSTDGVTWTFQTSNTVENINCIIWTGTQFMAADNAGYILTSSDGITWNESFATGTPIYSIAYNNVIYIIVAQNGNIFTSPDALVWTIRGSQSIRTIKPDGTGFIAIGYSGLILSSPDGITWTTLSAASNTIGFLNDIIHNGNQYIAVGYSGVIMTSPDAVVWTVQNSVAPDIYSIIWDGTRYIATSGGDYYFQTTKKDAAILTSSDGINWTTNYMPWYSN